MTDQCLPIEFEHALPPQAADELESNLIYIETIVVRHMRYTQISEASLPAMLSIAVLSCALIGANYAICLGSTAGCPDHYPPAF